MMQQVCAGLLDWAGGELPDASSALEHVEHGRLFSLSLDVPAALHTAAARLLGDRMWRAPGQALALTGSNTVAGLERFSGARLREMARKWTLAGTSAQAPILFFTAGAAPHPESPELFLPKVMVRAHGQDVSMTFNALRGSLPVNGVLADWLDELRMMCRAEPVPHGGAAEGLAFVPSREEWADRVHEATDAISIGRFAKVVLARKTIVTMPAPIDARHLAEQLAAGNPDGRIIVLPCGDGQLVAASPELLAVKQGNRITSHALAGTAARMGGADAEARAAAQLFASPKERREHAIVVEDIAGVLRELCSEVMHAPEPSLMKLPRLQHLWTPVSGTLRDGVGLLDVVERLHPTPAVLGSPRLAAKAWLEAKEEHRDGLYTGAAGWMDLTGDGECAVVLRSAYIDGRCAHLWAGAGIMQESDAASEWRETELKMSKLMELLTGSAA